MRCPDGLGDLLDGLHAGGAGADHRHPLAGEAHRLVRPARGVEGGALKRLDALDARHGRRRQWADRGDQEARPVAAAVFHRDVPLARVVPVMRRAHAAVEGDVAAEVELVGDKVEIAQRLGLRSEMLGPVPFLQQLLREGIAVGVAFGIEARAGIAIPVPRAADARPGLEHADPQPELAQPVELIEARYARADDEGVEVLGFARLHDPARSSAGRVRSTRAYCSSKRRCLSHGHGFCSRTGARVGHQRQARQACDVATFC